MKVEVAVPLGSPAAGRPNKFTVSVDEKATLFITRWFIDSACAPSRVKKKKKKEREKKRERKAKQAPNSRRPSNVGYLSVA